MAEYFFGITDKGRVRDNNEDAFIAQTVMSNRFIAGCVIDGVGGYNGGEVAAALAKEVLLQQLSEDDKSADLARRMKEALINANDKIYGEKQNNKDNADMACVLTLALASTADNKFYYAHVGDTRLYLYRDGSLVKISKDHSFVGFLEDSGRLTEDAAMRHPKRNEINKALGFGGDIRLQADYIETGESPFLPGDLLLLCSDGLTDMLGTADINNVLQSEGNLKSKGTQLVQMANDRGGKDNITVVLVQHNKKRSTQKATKPKTVAAPAEMAPVVNKNFDNSGNTQSLIADKPIRPRRKTRWPLWIGIALLALAVAAALWYFSQPKTPVQPAATSTPGISANQQKLQDSIKNFTGDTLVLDASIWGDSILLNAPLQITADSLYVLSPTAFILGSNAGYKGVALSLAPACKYVVIDGLQFLNTDTAIQAYNNALALKNVRFQACAIPVATYFTFPEGRFVNTAAAAAIYLTDTLTKL